MKRILELEHLIIKHKALYYQGRPEISDQAYDALEDELRSIDPENFALSLVGTTPRGDNKVKHDKKMLSLNKTYELDELCQWMGENKLVGTWKIDGVSCSLIYKNGRLVLAKTRGDGTFGEDITKKALWMEKVPKTIETKGDVEIRGELFCREENFFTLSEEMVSNGLERPTSQRNIVAGLISRKDHAELCRYIGFYGFEVLGDELTLKTEIDKYKYLIKEGIEVPDFELMGKREELESFLETTKNFMAEGDIQLDGCVFTINDLSTHQELGYTAHHPRYRMAFKFQGESKVTKINEITWSISRNGILTPVAEVEPVELSGAKISRVTLHNYGMVKQFNLKANDKIEIVRSGEVIPKFLSVVEDGGGQIFVPKRGCDECTTDLEISGIRLICKSEWCPTKEKEAILNYIQKIGIEDLSSKRLDEILKMKLIKSIPDLYDLDVEKLMTLDKVQEKLASKLIRSIGQSTEVNFSTFLSALGISGGAYSKCDKVVMAGHDTIDKIVNLTAEQLAMIEGFAQKSAEDFVNSIQEKRELILRLKEKGFSFKEREIKDTPFRGKKVCITGALSEKRSVIEDRLRGCGAQVVGSVSKNTDYLLTNETDPTSSKFKKAIELKISIISEQELISMIE
jgi:DNA ligase (NAD+)